MNFKINVALINLNEQINFIDLEIDNQIEKCKNSIDVILKSVSEIKKIVLKLYVFKLNWTFSKRVFS